MPDIKIIGFDHTVSFAYFSRKSLKGFLKGIIKRDLLDHFNPRLNRLLKYIRFWIMKRNMNHLQIKITKENVERIISKYSNRSSFGIKIDIEGSEFEILPIVLDTLKLANFIIVEFHDIEINKVRFDYIIKTLSQFAVIAHLHCNNFDPVGLNGFPKTVELTFVNNKFSHNNKQRLELPLEYDYPNAKNRPDYSIVFA